VYICICNALTDKRVKQAVVTVNSQRPREVYAACDCRAQCGHCVKTILQMIRDHALQIEGEFQGAD
jgi:bacterioferritin-associated ferredoxin